MKANCLTVWFCSQSWDVRSVMCMLHTNEACLVSVKILSVTRCETTGKMRDEKTSREKHNVHGTMSTRYYVTIVPNLNSVKLRTCQVSKLYSFSSSQSRYNLKIAPRTLKVSGGSHHAKFESHTKKRSERRRQY